MKNSAVKAQGNRAGESEREGGGEQNIQAAVMPWLESTMESVETYARRDPWPFGLWMLGIGFVLGWKLKMW